MNKMPAKERVYSWLAQATFNEQDGCRHPLDIIAPACGITERHTIRCIQQLEREERLRVDRPRKRGQCNTYWVATWNPPLRAGVLNVLEGIRPSVQAKRAERRKAQCHAKRTATSAKGFSPRRLSFTTNLRSHSGWSRVRGRSEMDETSRLLERIESLEAANRKLSELLDESYEQTAGLQRQLVRAARVETVLRNELAKVTEQEPESDDVRELVGLWREEVKGGDKRVKVSADVGPRTKQVKWALRKFGKERCSNAILGATLDDWAMGRVRKSRGKTFNDIAKHILRDEETIERFEQMWLDRDCVKVPPVQPVTMDQFVELLNAKQVSSNQWEARCPAHDDMHASLRFAMGDKGIVARCWAGCETEKVAEAVGVPLSRWFSPEPVAAPVVRVPDPLPTAAQLAGWWTALRDNPRMLARLKELKGWKSDVIGEFGVGWDHARKRVTIPVHNAAGELVNVIRYLPGGSPKSLALRNRPRDMFPAPELHQGEVWLMEGEPDALAGRSVNLPAVAIPGVNGWRKEWAQRLADRDVVVCFDCDAQGRKATTTVAEALVGIAKTVYTVDLDRDRDDGWDVCDAVAEGMTTDIFTFLMNEFRPGERKAA